MITQDTFSLFKKDASSRFDWAVIVLSGGFLVIVSFVSAWYFLKITQESAKDIILPVNNAVVLDKETFEIAEKKFTERKENLASILLESEEDIAVEENVQEDETEESFTSLEDE